MCKQSTSELRICAICKNPLLPRHRLYCSKACYGIANKGKKIPLPNLDSPRNFGNCVICGNPLRQGQLRCCSKECAGIHFRGSNHPNWKNGYITDGYHMIRINAQRKLAHRQIMEEHLGRALLDTEVVHHIDGNRKNNAIENLQVLPSQSAHITLHLRKYLLTETHRECHVCRQVKKHSEFHAKNRHSCKICMNRYAAEYRARKKKEKSTAFE